MSQSRPIVEIKEYGAKIDRPTVILGIPDVGLVGTIACSYLVEQLKLQEVGHVDSDLVPQVMVVHNSRVANPVHIFSKDQLVIVLSEVPLSPRLSLELARELAKWSKDRGAVSVIGATGLPSREREESQATQKPGVVHVASDDKAKSLLEPLKLSTLENGVISGAYASLLKQCMDMEQSCAILLSESLLSFPDPAAAAAILEVLERLLDVKIDLNPLLKESEEIRLRSRELIRQMQQASSQEQQPQQQPGPPPTAPGVYK